MAFSLPGLGLSTAPQSRSAPLPSFAAAESVTRTQRLNERTEWRFEVAFGRQYTIKLTQGTAELWGTELAVGQTCDFAGYKGAVFTWHGCTLEITGDAESEYVAQETEHATEWLNVHGMLETLRAEAEDSGTQGEGPRVLVVGPDAVGKSSLLRSLAAWGVRVGRSPTVLNLDPREGLLSPAGCITAVTVSSQTDTESGFGITPVSGPTAASVRTPLIYSWPYASPTEHPAAFKSLLTHAALHVTGKLEATLAAKHSGLLIDSPGFLNDPKSSYDLLAHIISEFSITHLITIGSERMYNDLNRRFGQTRGDDKAIPVLRLTKPGGAVERDAAFMKLLRAQETRQYFFGPPHTPLNPHSHSIPFSELSIYRARTPSDEADDAAYQPGMDFEPDGSSHSSGSLFEKVEPSTAMTASLMAIKFCSGSGTEESEVRDSAVMGWLYVADVDEVKKRVRFLAPHPQRWGNRALVWGGFPEAVGDLVT
ncbi:hypothetical protein B0A48_16422 [Cryoendolithus antarcticus]|uniref:Polynucleotide 5'-hydroxyl-kinase GRC3 n=1 Tax=Cryoendolithus antarcticus TaxID=1507870 RepID=A0A1V8SDV7_9PEZI|nr:hypothetical protein B0A48_16422 [Cryoendolithus antarcticus]